MGAHGGDFRLSFHPSAGQVVPPGTLGRAARNVVKHVPKFGGEIKSSMPAGDSFQRLNANNSQNTKS